MSKFTHAGGARFTRRGLAEAVAEVSLTAAAAAFTAVIWLSVGAWGIAPTRSAPTPTVNANATAPVQHVTLPTVVIVGRRDALEGPPAVTTAQNTAATPITLRQ